MTEVTASNAELQDKVIAKALEDPTKKRKASEEIEIDLSKSVPLSKKQKRLLRRGKVTLEELNAKYNLDPKSIEEYHKESEEKNAATKESIADSSESSATTLDESENSQKKVRKFGVWIGNLSFDTSKEDIIRYITAKTSDLEEDARIKETDVVRINMPLSRKDTKKLNNKGFAYVDLRTKDQMDAVIALSETQLNGRNLLIKSSNNFEGRPDKSDLISMSKNPKSRILFVGNLSFDTSEDLLRKHFQHCGEIVRIRMATFEDSGKCKGFAFIDFKDDSGPTAALTDRSCRKLASRPLRMEYGEDRSGRHVRKKHELLSASERPATLSASTTEPEVAAPTKVISSLKPRKAKQSHTSSKKRVKSSIALASAQRASAAITPITGKKVTFD